MTEIDYTAYLQGALVLTAEGEWLHERAGFQNKRIARLFSESVVWDEREGDYVVRLGRQQARFSYEDTPIFVLELFEDVTPWKIRLSDTSILPLSPDSLSMSPAGNLYCMVPGAHGHTIRARFARSAHQALLAHALSDETIEIAGAPVQIRMEKSR